MRKLARTGNEHAFVALDVHDGGLLERVEFKVKLHRHVRHDLVIATGWQGSLRQTVDALRTWRNVLTSLVSIAAHSRAACVV